jgi:formamidopyrimidine-DNA glycosylase
MIGGRLHWRPPDAKLAGRQNLAAFDFSAGTLILTEAGSARRASLHVLSGEESLRSVDPGGIDILTSELNHFRTTLTSENRTLKRALTDPRLVSGVGNAYSDEILHAAQLSPIALTHKLTPQQWEQLFTAARETLQLWTDRLRAEARTGFPEKVTAFRKGMAVHGRYGEPCPRCGDQVLRIRYADKETNYCARCQTGGKVLADRSLSRLLGSDWPRTLDELHFRQRGTHAFAQLFAVSFAFGVIGMRHVVRRREFPSRSLRRKAEFFVWSSQLRAIILKAIRRRTGPRPYPLALAVCTFST